MDTFLKNKREKVIARIELVKKLTSLKSHFKGADMMKHYPDGTWTHPYQDYSALRYYLCLTCFDILGSRDNFYDFGSWLRSKRTMEEVKQAIASITEQPGTPAWIESIHNRYLESYGSVKAFKRFINRVISPESRDKLLWTIRIALVDLQTGLETEILTDETEKINFLLKARNSFTHDGISFASSGGGIFDLHDPDDGILRIGNEKVVGYDVVHMEQQKPGIAKTYMVRMWPSVLIDIIEEQVNAMG